MTKDKDIQEKLKEFNAAWEKSTKVPLLVQGYTVDDKHYLYEDLLKLANELQQQNQRAREVIEKIANTSEMDTPSSGVEDEWHTGYKVGYDSAAFRVGKLARQWIKANLKDNQGK